MANQLDRLLEGVSENPTIHGSVAQLMRNIAAEAEQAGTSANPSAATALGGSLKTHADHIASHVLANTPVISATPPVHTAPAHSHTHEDPTSGAEPTPAAAEVEPYHRTKRQIAADQRRAAAEEA